MADRLHRALAGEGKLHLCAVKDVSSNRIVGYAISDCMKASLAVDALTSAVARRTLAAVTGCAVQGRLTPIEFETIYQAAHAA